jgi:DNA/RNA-binding domain of Phe-tRNA-synthetase-like protein
VAEGVPGVRSQAATHPQQLEALLRRAASGLPRVNRLTDVYNAVSVLHQVPLGGEDLTRYAGAPRLVRAAGRSLSTPWLTA